MTDYKHEDNEEIGHYEQTLIISLPERLSVFLEFIESPAMIF